jgi:phosphoribosylformylglycinamidine synthase
MKFGVVNFPSSTGFADTVYALQFVLEQEVVEIWHDSHSLPSVDVVIIPSGASFGDEPVRAVQSPVMQAIRKFADSRGIVLGINNGFQILCQAQLLEGKLTANQSGCFVGENVFVKVSNTATPFTRLINKDQILQLPIAHACGRYQADTETTKILHQRGQILMRYSSSDGTVSSLSNPDGSVDNIAAICNEHMNVFGMMACIERAVDPDLGNANGMLFFESLINGE